MRAIISLLLSLVAFSACAQMPCASCTAGTEGMLLKSNGDGTASPTTTLSKHMIWAPNPDPGSDTYVNQEPLGLIEFPNNRVPFCQWDASHTHCNNFMYYDDAQGIIDGPNWDRGLHQRYRFGQEQRDVTHTRWDWIGNGMPPGLAATGSYYTDDGGGGDLNHLFTSTSSSGSLTLSGVNVRTNISYLSDTYFIEGVQTVDSGDPNSLADTCINLQFGLQTANRSAGIEFAFYPNCSTGEHAKMDCTIWNAAVPNGHTISTGIEGLLTPGGGGRNFFHIHMDRPRSPHSAGDQVEFWAGDPTELVKGLIYKKYCAFDRDDTAMPAAADNLIPFSQHKITGAHKRQWLVGARELIH